MKTYYKIRTLVVLLTFLTTNDANAEGTPGPPEKRGWTFSVGAGAIYAPSFPGSKEYQLFALPDFKAEYGERFFASPFQGIGYKVIAGESWSAGPIVKVDFGRDEETGNPLALAGKTTDALKGMGNLDPTPEVGGFVEYSLGSFSYTLEIAQGIGGHEGLRVEASADFQSGALILGRQFMFMTGPRLTFADSNYNNAYFGITEKQSLGSGLSRYKAESALISYSFNLFIMTPLTDSISLGFLGGYDRLVGTAEKSPLIKERGDVNQFMGAIRFGYEW